MIETSIEPEVVSSFSFGKAISSTFTLAPSFASTSPVAAAAPPTRLSTPRRPEPG
jgi:hypothetical protein